LKRGSIIHLSFRSTYNLCFEVVRLPGQVNYLCNDQDAVKINDHFKTGCDNWKKLFQSSQTRSFGVREELRGSGVAIIKLLDIAYENVSTKSPTTLSVYLIRAILLSGKSLSVIQAYYLDPI
jgi:hypothetical protein